MCCPQRTANTGRTQFSVKHASRLFEKVRMFGRRFQPYYYLKQNKINVYLFCD